MQLSLKEKLQIVVSRFDEFSNQKYVTGYDSKGFVKFREALTDLHETSKELSETFVIGSVTLRSHVHAAQEQAYHYLQLSKEEFYYLSCILGHLVPAGKISKSLLDKVSLDELDCSDFDLIQLKGDEVGGYSITINEEKE